MLPYLTNPQGRIVVVVTVVVVIVIVVVVVTAAILNSRHRAIKSALISRVRYPTKTARIRDWE
jgi:hypothetical protein